MISLQEKENMPYAENGKSQLPIEELPGYKRILAILQTSGWENAVEETHEMFVGFGEQHLGAYLQLQDEEDFLAQESFKKLSVFELKTWKVKNDSIPPHMRAVSVTLDADSLILADLLQVG